MFIISSRNGLDNEDAMAPRETVWEVTTQGGTETGRRQSSIHELQNKAKDKDVLLLVHGYNNEFEDVLRAYEIIELQTKAHLNDQYAMVVGYTWPGGNNATDWYRAKRRAGVVATRLSRVIQQVTPNALDLMTHSLGARVAMKAIGYAPNRQVRNLHLMASAVDNESLEQGQEFFPATNKTTRNFVFYTKHDNVLKYAYTAAEWDSALGHRGPENPASIIDHSPNVAVVNCKNKVTAHGHYKYVDDVYRFIAQALAGNRDEQFFTL